MVSRTKGYLFYKGHGQRGGLNAPLRRQVRREEISESVYMYEQAAIKMAAV